MNDAQQNRQPHEKISPETETSATGSSGVDGNLPQRPASSGKHAFRSMLIAVLGLAVIIGGTLLVKRYSDERSIIKTDNEPAAGLKRDDAAGQLEAKLFVTTSVNQNTFSRDGERYMRYSAVLSVDEKACVAYYGKDGLIQCRNNWDMLDLRQQDWKLIPDQKGTWEVRSGTYTKTLEYSTPIANVVSGSTVSIQLPQNLGKNVTPSAGTVRITLPSFDLSFSEWSFLVDPENPKKMMLQGVLTSGLYSLDEASLKSNLSINVIQADQQQDGAKAADAHGLMLGEPQIVMNKQGTQANIHVPVLELPGCDVTASLLVNKGVLQRGQDARSPRDISVGTTVPGRDVFVRAGSVDATTVTDDDLNTNQLLVIVSTQKVDVAAAQKALEAYLLPVYRTEEEKAEKVPTDWANIPASQITDKDIAAAQRIPLTPVPSADNFETIVSSSFSAPFYTDTPSKYPRYLFVHSPGGAPSDTGYAMAGFSAILRSPVIANELRIMQRGSILSMGGTQKLAVFSRGLPKYRVETYRVRPEYVNILISKSRSYALSETDLNYDYGSRSSSTSFPDISERFVKEISTGSKDGQSPDYTSIDLSPMLKDGAKGIFYITLGDPDNDAQYDKYDERFLLVTDLGINVKLAADGSRDVFISSLFSGKPCASVTVQVIGRNGLPLMTATTDKLGQAKLPPLNGFYKEKEPVAITASLDNDFTYMPLDDSSRGISLSSFPETMGREVYKGGLSLFVFSERGIFLPGENLRFGLLAKPTNWDSSAVSGLPLKANLMDPRGNVVFTKTLKLDETGLGALDIPMQREYPTGRYNLDVYLDQTLLGSQAVQVEEFQPDKLKVRVGFDGVLPSGQKGWLTSKNLDATVEVENLYGTPAVASHVAASFNLTPVGLYFKDYSDYSFYNPLSDKNRAYHSELSGTETDKTGVARLFINLNEFEEGTYMLDLTAQALEAGGGRGVYAKNRVMVSPLQEIVGYKSTAKLDFLAKDAPAVVSFLAVNSSLEKTELENLTVRISEITYVASLVQNNQGKYRYEKTRRLKELKADTANLSSNGLDYSLPTDKTGEYELVMTDASGKERCRLEYLVAGGSQRRFGLERDATLRIRPEKKQYNAGEVMKLFVSAPYAGSGLITIESDRVLASAWFQTSESDSVQEITVPDNVEGKIYVSVSYTRSIESDAVHSTPFTFAVAAFEANIDKRDLKLSVKTPEKVRPGEKLTFSVKANRPGKAIIYAVSEGILQLTSYKSPSPLDFYLRSNPLSVSTSQTLDLFMPEYYLMNPSAYGGDMGLVGMGGQINPFRRKSEPSVVYWSGPLAVGTEETELSWTVPAYFDGTLRVMAVASGEGGVGEFNGRTMVQGPLIITPDLPVAVAPGDEFEVTAAIANNIEGSGKDQPVKVQVELDEGLSFLREPEKELSIDEGREGKSVFRLKANSKLGESAVTIRAWTEGSKAESVVRPVSLSVRPASPRMSAFKAGFVKEDSQTVQTGRSMYPEYASVEASVSGLPLPMVDALSGFLFRYPYGCTEQILSTAFPYAILHKTPELLPLSKGQTYDKARQKAVGAINRGIVTLAERQVMPGRFSLWPQERGTYSYLTVYGYDFLLSAREAGFDIPDGLLRNTRAQMETMLATRPYSEEAAKITAYAAWVYTRSGQRFTGLPELVKHLDENVKGWRAQSTAALLAASYKIMLQNKEADALISGVKAIPSDAYPGYNNWFLSRLWDNSMSLTVMARYFPDRLQDLESKKMLVAVINDSAGDYSTASATQAVRALTEYALGNMGLKHELKLTALDANNAPLPDEAIGEAVRRLSLGNQASAFNFSGGSGLYWQISTDGFDVTPPAAQAKKVNINVEYITGPDRKAGEFLQGDEVYVLLTANAAEPVDNVAITSLIPGGFEMVISKAGRIVGGGALDEGDEYAESQDDYYDDEEGTSARPNEALRNETQRLLEEAGVKGVCMDLVHVERREDRMVVYTSLNQNSRMFMYRIKAINKGRFTQPSVFVEALYNRDVRANTAPNILVIN